MPNKPSIIVAAKTLLVHQRRVLILRRSETDTTCPGTWELPGGKLEFGETPQDAALRELREESGISGTLGPILYADSIMGIRGPRQFIVLVYLAHAETAEVTLSFEHADFLWASKAQVRQMLTENQVAMLERHGVLDNPDIDIEE